MAIPGVKPELPLRAKVRVGAKDASGNVVALDHFVSEDDSFVALAGEKPKELRVRFPYAEAERCFPSGLEKWMRGRSGPILGCYTKGDGTAHRLGKKRDAAGLIILDPTPPAQRGEMPCAAGDCPYYGTGREQGCRPVARLNFLLVDDPRRDSVWRFETKSLNTIELIEGVLSQYPDCRAHTFILAAERRKKGPKQFTVVTIREDSTLDAEPVSQPSAVSSSDANVSSRQRCKAALEALGQWPPNEATVAWINEKGHDAAADALEKRVAARG